MKTIGENIRVLRKLRDMTQAQLPAQLGEHHSTISLWETNKRFPTLEVAADLADIFEVSLDDLAGRKWPRKETKC